MEPRVTPRRRAAVWLAAYVAGISACLAAVQSGRSINSFARPAPAMRGDIRLYWDVVQRVREGEGYYTAMHAELVRHGYPTSSVFNWRTPPVLWLMARLPAPTDGMTVMFCAAAGLIAFAFLILRNELGVTAAYGGGFLMLGAVLPCFVGDVCIVPLQWGAVCVGLSLCCFATDRTRLGVLLGTLAAFFSELTLGYAVLMAAVAAWRKRRNELLLWTAGLVVLAACFAWHAGMVSRRIGTNDVVNARAWLQFRGLPFLIAAAQMNCWLLPLPPWLAAVYLPTALLGLARWRSPMGRRCGLFAAAYCVLFLCIGQPFNQYWGLLLAPPLALGAARAPRAAVELWLGAVGIGTSRTVCTTLNLDATSAYRPPVA